MQFVKKIMFCLYVFTFQLNSQTVALITYANASCTGPCDGVATFSVIGATGPFSVNITNTTCAISNTLSSLSDSITFTNLCKCTGAYTFSFYDGSSVYIDSQTLNIFAPSNMNLFANNSPISCMGACNSTGTVTTFNGTAPFNYTWTPGGMTSPIASSLCPGFYTIVVVDANGCLDATSLIINNSSNPCVGIHEIENISHINIYPNPVSNLIYFSLKNHMTNSTVQFFNSLGQIVLSVTATNEVDVSKLPIGLYYVKIITETNESYFSKIIKE